MRVLDVPAPQGWLWIKQSWPYFRSAPFNWLSLIGGWIIVTFGLLLVPLIGQVAANLLQPAFFAGFMLAARDQDNGAKPQLAHLFAAFRGNYRALLMVGSVLLVGELLIFLVLYWLGFPEITMTPDGMNIDIEAFRSELQDKIGVVILGMGLTALFKGALWFAAPLIAFHNMSASHAIRWSVYAFIANFGALLLYGVLIMVIYAVAMVPYGAGLLVAMPLMVISNYTGYKALFQEDQPVPVTTSSEE
jgi:hypothetical protein